MAAETLRLPTITEKARLVASAVQVLQGIGHEVIGFDAGPGAIPTVQLRDSELLRRMVEHDWAMYYRVGVEPNGQRYRMGQFEIGNVRAVWRENLKGA